jgi:hypothetical protein
VFERAKTVHALDRAATVIGFCVAARRETNVFVYPVANEPESSARFGVNVSALRAILFVSQPIRRDTLQYAIHAAFVNVLTKL